ncbi:MiaB/RimO family radical SAM methylthiotransferase [Patescibacteria group bacterium]|nr:MiaB/RimO family radical SAM methylthiotransferase [Patescibacteria group bacterium]
MNYSDSERIAAVLESAGYKSALSEDKVDLIVINACSVRKSAVDRIAGNFKKYNKFKKKNPDLKIILTGCVLESDKKRFEKLFDLIVDIKEIHRWLHSPEGLWSPNAKQQKGSTALKGLWSQHSNYFQIQPKYQNKSSAYVPIMTGCNNFCSYCVVPYTRGREYSRPVEEILDEIAGLVEKGYKEIILLGQNVNSYESKIKNQELKISKHTNPSNKSNPTNWIPASAGMTEVINFPALLKLVNNIPGNFWIRFLTSHPKDMTEELIKTVAGCEKVTPYIHIALQSGDNEILKKMNRKYTAEHFLNLVKLVRKYIPDAAITTDIIVGFPSETEKQFQNTAEIMRKAKFDMAYINKYSPRAGTTSAKLDDDVSWEEKKRREKILTEILKETALENNKKYVGKVVDILVDKVDEDCIHGKTGSFKSVKIGIKNQELRIKEENFIKIKITQAGTWGLEGEM